MEKHSFSSSQTVRDISFKCGRLRLAGTLHMPPGTPRAAVIGCHGMLANRTSAKQVALASKCTESAMAYFRFDHRGCGQSQGELRLAGILDDRRDDLLAALETIYAIVGPDIPIGLFGSSLGGTVVLQVAAETGLTPIVTVAAPVKMDQVSQATLAHLKDQGLDLAPGDGSGLAFDITPCLDKISGALVLHGGLDDVVPVDNAHTIHQRVKAPKRIVVIADSDHAFSQPDYQKRLVELARTWLQNLLVQ